MSKLVEDRNHTVREEEEELEEEEEEEESVEGGRLDQSDLEMAEADSGAEDEDDEEDEEDDEDERGKEGKKDDDEDAEDDEDDEGEDDASTHISDLVHAPDSNAGKEDDSRDTPPTELTGPVKRKIGDEADVTKEGEDGIKSTDPTRKRRRRNHSFGTHLRVKGLPLERRMHPRNAKYAALLSGHIGEVNRQRAAGDWEALTPSQVGLTAWTPEEKDALYEALGRLGRDDVLGIAQRLGSKSPLEVQQYLCFMQDDLQKRKDAGLSHKPVIYRPFMVDIPAAVEVSDECCLALERLADGMALQQERDEEAREVARVGEENWLVTSWNCRSMTEAAAAMAASTKSPLSKLPSTVSVLSLFQVPTMLRLSEDVFMNGATMDCNWHAVSEQPPSIRMETLEDLYELVRSLTQRLTAAALHFGASRVRSQIRGTPKKTQLVVRRRDVAAAAASLGLKTNAKEFWARCPRRVNLRVYENEDGIPRVGGFKKGERSPAEEDETSSEDDKEKDIENATLTTPEEVDQEAKKRKEDAKYRPMTFDKVEEELLLDVLSAPQELYPEVEEDDSEEDEDEGEDYEGFTYEEDERDAVEEEGGTEDTLSDEGEHGPDFLNDMDEETRTRIFEERKEALQFSALHFNTSCLSQAERRVNWSFFRRIAVDLKLENWAEAVDMQASRAEEQKLWEMLGAEPPAAMDPQEEERARDIETKAIMEGEYIASKRRYPLDVLLNDGSGNWRQRLASAYQNEWEGTATSVERAMQERARKAQK